MNKPTTINLSNGKYTIQHEHGANLRALRHGEPWRELTGDGLILAMAQRIEELEVKLDPIKSVAKRVLVAEDGENMAVRSFLAQISCDRSITIDGMKGHMNRSGWEDTHPDWAVHCWAGQHLTKFSAQSWIRHLFDLEKTAT